MKKFFTPKLIVLFSIAIVAMAAGTAVKYGSNPPEAHTNAPGEQNCTACHSGTLNPTPSNLNNFTLTTNFTGGGYIPDSTYTLTVKYTETGITRFGFQITALTKTGDNPIGTFTAGSGSSKVTGSVSGKTREYLRHNGGGGSSNGKGEWTFTWQAPKAPADSIVFYVVVNATNSDGFNSGDAIYAKTFTFGPSNLLPVAQITANKTSICTGDTISFMGTGTNNTTQYSWKFKSGTPTTSSAQNPKIVFLTPGTYTDTLRVTNNKGVSAPATFTFTVNATPVANIASVQPSNTICAGEEATLSATFGTGYRYKWNTGNPADTFSTVKVSTNGSYSVTVTNSGGCVKTSPSTTITVKTKPGLSLTSSAVNDTVCQTEAITFTAQSFSGFDTYTFRKNGNVVQNSANNVYKTALSPNDTISVVGTVGGCDSDPAQLALVVKTPLAAPTVTCGNATTSTLVFNWTAVAGAVGYEVSTNGGTNWAAPSSGTMGLSHTINGLSFSTPVQLMVRAIDNAPCNIGAIGTKACTTLSCSGVTYDLAISDTLLCPNDSSTITISNISAPKFSLRMGNGAYGTATVFVVKPAQTTDYTFELIDSSALSCPPLTFTARVAVDVVPVPVLSATPGTTVCIASPVELTATTAGITKYTVIANGSTSTLTNSTGVFSNVQVNDGDKVAMEIETPAGCKTQSNELVFKVNPLPLPGFTTTINNLAVDFDDTTNTAQSRTWRFGDGATSTLKNPSHTYATVGNFDVTLIVTSTDGCIDSTSKSITTENVSIGEIVGLSQFDIYPNPTKGMLQLDFEWLGQGALSIAVMDISGKKVWSNTISQNGQYKQVVDLSDFADGTYLLQLSTPNGQHTFKVLKTK